MLRLADEDRHKVQEALAGMMSPVRLVFFTQATGCESCALTRQIIDQIVPLSDQLTVEEYNLVLDREQAAQYGVDKAPAIALVGARDPGIRFYGAPAGYEFASLIDAILLVSNDESGFAEQTRALVAAVDAPVDIQVFVTPT